MHHSLFSTKDSSGQHPYVLLENCNEKLIDEIYFEKLKLHYDLPENVIMLCHQGVIGKEIRRFNPGWWFVSQRVPGAENLLEGTGQKKVPGVETLRLFSFGACQLACPYCKRDMQSFVDAHTAPIALRDLFRLAEWAVQRGERVRLSGGDPSFFPKVSIAIARYTTEVMGSKASIAHHSLAANWLKEICPFLISAALDLKGVPGTLPVITGLLQADGEKLFRAALSGIRTAAESGVLLDVRTPLFSSTSDDDMRFIAKYLESLCLEGKNIFWTWRPYKPIKHSIPDSYRTPCVSWEAPEKEKVIESMLKISEEFPQLPMGVKLAWNNSGMTYFLGGKIINEDLEKGWIND